MLKYIATYFLVLFTFLTVAQNTARIDSLENVLKASPPDSIKYDICLALNDEYYYYDYVKCKEYIQLALPIAKKRKDKSGEAFCYSELGLLNNYTGETELALEYALKSVGMYQVLQDSIMIATTLNNAGYIYYTLGKVDSCVNYYIKSLNIKEALGDKQSLATAYVNLGYIVSTNVDQRKGLSYYLKSLKNAEESDFVAMQGTANNNIGYSYLNYFNQPDSAMPYYQKALEIAKQQNNSSLEAAVLNNLARIHEINGDVEAAKENLLRALDLNYQLNDFSSAANIHYRLAGIFNKEEDFKQALYHVQKGETTLGEIKNADTQLSMYYTAFEVYQKTGNFEKALNYYLMHDNLEDSVKSSNNTKIVGEIEAKYQNEKKQLEIDNLNKTNDLNAKKSALDKIEIERQNTLIAGITIGLGLLSLLVFAIYRGYVNKKKDNTLITQQKKLVEHQKLEVEEKNKEILDSITYAKRIQAAILPPGKLVKEYLKESFILYKPKDIVAGDFYWMEQKEGSILFAAADCTGHGVPGAMVSVVCNNGLNRSVREFGLTIPGEILDKTRELVIQEFEKSEEEVKDGMDISICNLKGNMLTWAGANNPLWIIREGEIIEYKADKQPIGKFADAKLFTTHSIDLLKGDTIYIFTDGFVDQFGGEKGKKFLSANFKKLLLSVQELDLEAQKVKIDAVFEEWKTKEEQVDDVCIIGFRV